MSTNSSLPFPFYHSSTENRKPVKVMDETPISELVEDEKQKLLYVFDYLTERCFFIELSEIITGKNIDKAVCTKKSGEF